MIERSGNLRGMILPENTWSIPSNYFTRRHSGRVVTSHSPSANHESHPRSVPPWHRDGQRRRWRIPCEYVEMCADRRAERRCFCDIGARSLLQSRCAQVCFTWRMAHRHVDCIMHMPLSLHQNGSFCVCFSTPWTYFRRRKWENRRCEHQTHSINSWKQFCYVKNFGRT